MVAKRLRREAGFLDRIDSKLKSGLGSACFVWAPSGSLDF